MADPKPDPKADAPKIQPATRAAMPGTPEPEPITHTVTINDEVFTWKEGEPVPAEAKEVYEASVEANNPTPPAEPAPRERMT